MNSGFWRKNNGFTKPPHLYQIISYLLVGFLVLTYYLVTQHILENYVNKNFPTIKIFFQQYLKPKYYFHKLSEIYHDTLFNILRFAASQHSSDCLPRSDRPSSPKLSQMACRQVLKNGWATRIFFFKINFVLDITFISYATKNIE